jgi:RimJ/RimL family protein N-acetyltransferase
MIIRKIEIKDSERFLNMLKQLDNETNHMMFEPGERKTTIEEMELEITNIHDSKSLLLVAEDNGEIVGFLSSERGFAKRIRHRAYIVVGILKDYWGRKIGVQLFEELEKWALGNTVTRLELTVMQHNEGAIRLYEKMGFKKEGLKENSMIVDGKYVNEYYMAKNL